MLFVEAGGVVGAFIRWGTGNVYRTARFAKGAAKVAARSGNEKRRNK